MSNVGRGERIRWLHKRIKEGYYPNAQRVSEKFEISHRQAQRDVDHLKNGLGAPIEFDPMHRGYRYTADFDIPDSFVGEQPEELSEMVVRAAGDGMQMFIPYSAVVEIPDKLTALEFAPLIASRAGGDKYKCEFFNVNYFLGAVLAAGGDIRIVSPDWLREKLIESAERAIYVNRK